MSGEHAGAESSDRPTQHLREVRGGRVAAGGKGKQRLLASDRKENRSNKPRVADNRSGQHWETCACPAAQIVWRGYEWVRPIEERSVYCDKASAAEQQSLIARNRADHNSCVFLSLLAFHRAGESREFFDQSQWGPVARQRLSGVLGQYSRATRSRVVVHTLNQDGCCEAQVVIGSGNRKEVRLCVLPSGDGCLHCLPLGTLRQAGRARIPEGIRGEFLDQGTSAEEPAPVITVEPAPDAPPAVLAPVPEAEEEGEGGEDWEVIHHEQFYSTLPGSGPVIPYSEVSLCCPDMAGRIPPSYRGIQAPPPDLGTVRWRGGWFPSQCPESPSLFSPLVENQLFSVDYASATLDNFHLFGTAPLYSEVRFEGGLQQAGRRTVTDGQKSVEFFTAGDVLHVGSSAWSVQRVVDGWVRVTAATLGAYWRESVPFSLMMRNPKVQAKLIALDAETRAKAIWQLVCNTNTDATETAMLTRMRGDAAQRQYTGADAESSADLVRVLASRYRSAGNVAGPYAWGYCYSCGKPLRGKMQQRICCKGKNSDCARLVADGEKVTSHAAPIRYPGVVWTKSRHPPLKKGVQTVATERNFHMPRRGSRIFLPHHHATVRDSVVSGSTGLSRS